MRCGRVAWAANNLTGLVGESNPQSSKLLPLGAEGVVLFPDDIPRAQLTQVAGEPIPLDPRSPLTPPGDVFLEESGPVDVTVETTNVPLNWTVSVLVTKKSGFASTYNAAFVSGDSLAAVWSATISALPSANLVALQARAKKP